jgi:hypothetical protein
VLTFNSLGSDIQKWIGRDLSDRPLWVKRNSSKMYHTNFRFQYLKEVSFRGQQHSRYRICGIVLGAGFKERFHQAPIGQALATAKAKKI